MKTTRKTFLYYVPARLSHTTVGVSNYYQNFGMKYRGTFKIVKVLHNPYVEKVILYKVNYLEYMDGSINFLKEKDLRKEYFYFDSYSIPLTERQLLDLPEPIMQLYKCFCTDKEKMILELLK